MTSLADKLEAVLPERCLSIATAFENWSPAAKYDTYSHFVVLR